MRRPLPRSVRAGLFLAAALVALGPGARGADERELAKLAVETELVARLVELASGDEFYLVVDPTERTLRLMLKGAELRRYAVLALEVADPTVGFVSRGQSHTWQGKVWTGGALLPARELDRVEIKVPPPGAEATEAEAVIPPTPEERFPVPPRFGIRYQGGLFVEILSEGADSAQESLGHRMRVWWDDFKAALRPTPTDRVRLRVTLALEDANAVYRSLPPGTQLLILPPH